MASPYPVKDIANTNTAYHSAVITSLAIGYSMLGKKLIRLDVGDPARPEFIKLSVVVTLSMFTKDWLVKQKLIPDDILHN